MSEIFHASFFYFIQPRIYKILWFVYWQITYHQFALVIPNQNV